MLPDSEKLRVLEKTLLLIAKTLRNYPMDIEFYLQDSELMAILANGSERDPEGYEYLGYFISKAKEGEKL